MKDPRHMAGGGGREKGSLGGVLRLNSVTRVPPNVWIASRSDDFSWICSNDRSKGKWRHPALGFWTDHNSGSVHRKRATDKPLECFARITDDRDGVVSATVW